MKVENLERAYKIREEIRFLLDKINSVKSDSAINVPEKAVPRVVQVLQDLVDDLKREAETL